MENPKSADPGQCKGERAREERCLEHDDNDNNNNNTNNTSSNNNNNNHGRNFGAFPSFRAMVFSCPGAVFRAGAAPRAEAV